MVKSVVLILLDSLCAGVPHSLLLSLILGPERLHRGLPILDSKETDQVVEISVGNTFNVEVQSNLRRADRGTVEDVNLFVSKGHCL